VKEASTQNAFSLVDQDMVGKAIVAIFHVFCNLKKKRGITKIKILMQRFMDSIFLGHRVHELYHPMVTKWAFQTQQSC